MSRRTAWSFFHLFWICVVFTNCDFEASSDAEGKQSHEVLTNDSTANQITDKPVQKAVPTYDTAQWARVIDLDSTIVEDLRYATEDNFVGEVMYDCASCYLRPEAAKAVVAAHQLLKKQGYGGLKLFDCYRPRPIQQKLWDKVPDARYVTPPTKGSMHNRGLAVDLTIIDTLGNQLDMGTRFDYFGVEGYHTYSGHSEEIQANRNLLKETLKKVGFRPIRTEWWHYSYRKVSYPIADWEWDCSASF